MEICIVWNPYKFGGGAGSGYDLSKYTEFYGNAKARSNPKRMLRAFACVETVRSVSQTFLSESNETYGGFDCKSSIANEVHSGERTNGGLYGL